jgi:hypothetical protein
MRRVWTFSTLSTIIIVKLRRRLAESVLQYQFAHRQPLAPRVAKFQFRVNRELSRPAQQCADIVGQHFVVAIVWPTSSAYSLRDRAVWLWD